MTEAISFGAGVNSTAMTIMLVNKGWRGPIVFSDTGTEWPDTYCFMDMFEKDWLRPRGLEIVRLGGEWRSPSKAMSLLEHCEQYGVTPRAYPRWCTAGYKVLPLNRWCKEHGIGQEGVLLGIAVDERHRMPDRIRPLVDHEITRAGCVDIIVAEGLSVPRKSGCYICPFQRDQQWRDLWERYPELYARAEMLERPPRKKKGRAGMPTGLVIDPAGKMTLVMRRRRYESQSTMPFLEDPNLLLAKPCICGL